MIHDMCCIVATLYAGFFVSSFFMASFVSKSFFGEKQKSNEST